MVLDRVLAASGRGGGIEGIAGIAGIGGILVRAKQIKQRPPKNGFGSSSKARPHSGYDQYEFVDRQDFDHNYFRYSIELEFEGAKIRPKSDPPDRLLFKLVGCDYDND